MLPSIEIFSYYPDKIYKKKKKLKYIDLYEKQSHQMTTFHIFIEPSGKKTYWTITCKSYSITEIKRDTFIE